MDGFKAFINRLDGRLQLGLVTASPEKMFNWINERLHLDSIFEHIVYGGMTSNDKPHPEPYLYAMNLFNMKAQHTIIIEDSVHGINAGLSSNAKVIAKTGSVNIADMPKAHTIINHFDEITEELINSLYE